MKIKLSVLFVFVFSLSVVLSACGGGGGESSDDAAAAGENLFNQTVNNDYNININDVRIGLIFYIFW